MPLFLKCYHKFVALLILSFLMTLPINALSQTVWGAVMDPKDIIFSLTFKNEPLKKVLEKISEVTSYKIAVDEAWMDVLVTASLKNVKIHEGLNKVLRNLNHAIIINDAERELSIVIYGSISPVKRQFKEATPIRKAIDPSALGLPAPDFRKEKQIDPSVLGLPALDLQDEKQVDPSVLGLPAPDLRDKKQIDPLILGLPVPDLRQKKQIDPHRLGLPTSYSSYPKSQHGINQQQNGEKTKTNKIGG